MRHNLANRSVHHSIHHKIDLCHITETDPQMKQEIPEGFCDFWLSLKPSKKMQVPSTAGQQIQANID